MAVLDIKSIADGWAQGQPVENLNLYGDITLDNLGRYCVELANRGWSQEKKDRVLAALQLIIAECNNRGLRKVAGKYQTAYRRLITPVKSENGYVVFAQKVYEQLIEICTENKAEIDDVKNIEDKLDNGRAPNLKVKPLTIFDFSLFTVDTDEEFKKMKLEYFTTYYFAKHMFGSDVVDEDHISIGGTTLDTNEFAQRLYYTNYNLWVMTLQSFLVADKISKKYPESFVMLSSNYDIRRGLYSNSIYVDLSKEAKINRTLEAEISMYDVIALPTSDIKTRQFDLIIGSEHCPFEQYANKCKAFMQELKTL